MYIVIVNYDEIDLKYFSVFFITIHTLCISRYICIQFIIGVLP